MPFEIIKPGTRIDFIGRWRIAAALSLTLLALSLVAIPLRGVRVGIDFAGGTEVQIRFDEADSVGEGEIREVVSALGIEGASVIRFGELGVNDFLIRWGRQDGEAASSGSEASDASASLPGAGSEGATGGQEERVTALRVALSQSIGEATVERVEYVGPRVGEELTRDGLLSLAVAALLILLYVGFRFSIRFAPGAIVAILHDVAITAGLWVILGFEFDLRVLAALLAIIGYSLNDTIIVYDRIRENMELRTKQDLPEVLNRSVNQTLSRTVLTSVTTLLAVAALIVLGGEVIRPFGIAMAIGIVVGTYSSIYVASPTLLYLERRFGSSAPAARGAHGAKA